MKAEAVVKFCTLIAGYPSPNSRADTEPATCGTDERPREGMSFMMFCTLAEESTSTSAAELA